MIINYQDDIVRIYDQSSEKDLLRDICANYTRKFVMSCSHEVLVQFFPNQDYQNFDNKLEQLSSLPAKTWKVSASSVGIEKSGIPSSCE